MALPNKTKIPIGTVLAGKYRITREIGRGGMAAVYEAENVDIGKRVAIKVLAQELTSSAIVVERFLREARAAAAIRSPYICDVYDSGKLDDGRPFLVLELLEGESLYERMTKVRYLDVDTTIAVIMQTCRGLTKAHSASIVHRDLKPENIFLTKDEEGHLLAKILDFGLAKFYAPVQGSAQQARLTREGAVFGTPAYMSPEQVRGQGAVDLRADLWALGCIVYECLTGRTVWATDQGVAMTFAQIANAPLPQPSQYRPDLPLSFTAWFNKALNRDINKRFQTAKEFAEELAIAFQQDRPSFSAITNISALLGQHSLSPIPKVPGPDPNPFLTPGLPGAPQNPLGGNGQGGNRNTEPTPPPFPLQPSTVPRTQQSPGSPHDLGGQGPTSPRGSKLGFVAPQGSHGTSDPPALRAETKPARGSGRFVLILGAIALVAGAGYAGFRQFIQPLKTPPIKSSANTPPPPLPSASASAAPSASANASPSVAPAPPWMPELRDAQELLAKGDLKGAIKPLKDAFDKGGHGVPRTMLEHTQVALSSASDRAPCRLAGLGRPRAYDLNTPTKRAAAAGRPAIVAGPRGPVVTWTDAHEGADHAYTVLLDEAMRNAVDPIDATPEGTQIGRPELARVGDKLVLTYWDSKGPEAGVHARFLDASGRIAGPQVAIAPSKMGNFWPSLAPAPDGSFYMVWSDDGDADSEDLFLRHLGPALDAQGPVVRLTDLVRTGAHKAKARLPSTTIVNNMLLTAFRLERDPIHLIYELRLPLTDTGKELEAPKKNGPKADRATGDLVLVNTDKGKADSPTLACGGGSCFLVWHGENGGGAWAAYIDPAKGQPLWRKKFSNRGGHPSVAVGENGQAQLIWFESGRVLTAQMGRDRIGTPIRIARVSGDQPMPSIAPGKNPGEWFVAWLDYETGHLEAYTARILCK